MAECAAVCEHAHLPAQSGSTRILKAMRRTYSRERYLALVERLRAAIPDLALDDRPDRRLSRRDRGGLRGDARRSSRTCASTAPSRSSSARAAAPRRPRCATRFPTSSSASGSSDSSRSFSASQPSATAERDRPGRGGARRGPEPHRPLAAPRPHATKHDGELRGDGRRRRARRRPDRERRRRRRCVARRRRSSLPDRLPAPDGRDVVDRSTRGTRERRRCTGVTRRGGVALRHGA